MHVRFLAPAEKPRWIQLRSELWPEQSREDLESVTPALIVFVAVEGDEIVAFLELDLRSYAEGCDSSPVPYIEAWYVVPEWRRRGVGAELMKAAEEWSRAQGYTELGSDAEAINRLSHVAHAAVGFQEVETIVIFRKAL